MNDDMKVIQESRDIMISALAQSMTFYGVTPSVGRIYGVLYFSTEPLTLDEIKVEVAMSKGSVSNGIRELSETGMVSKVWKKGERKDHYIAEKDYLRNFLTYFISIIRQEHKTLMKGYEQVQPRLENIVQETSDEQVKKEAVKDLNMIQNSQDYFDWTLRLGNAMENGEIFKYFPKVKKDKGDIR